MRTRVRKALCGAAAAALIVVAAAACASQTEQAARTPPPVDATTGQETPIGLPNPASVYCIEQGGALETRADADGNQSGFCVFPDGSEKNQWDFWRENHPAQTAAGSIADYAHPTEAPSGTPQVIRQVSAEESEEIARRFVLDSPTYRFDGIDGTLELSGAVTVLPSLPSSRWTFTFEFKSANAGYGDRTGQRMGETITPHRAVVTVEEGDAVSAVIDGEWDMMTQEMAQ